MPLAIPVFLACWFVSMYLYTKVSFLVSMCLCFSNWNFCTSVLGCASRYVSTMGISKVANGTGTFRRWVYQKWPMEQVRSGGNPTSKLLYAYSNILRILAPKPENFQKNSGSFHIAAQNIVRWYLLEPPLQPPGYPKRDGYLKRDKREDEKTNPLACAPNKGSTHPAVWPDFSLSV